MFLNLKEDFNFLLDYGPINLVQLLKSRKLAVTTFNSQFHPGNTSITDSDNLKNFGGLCQAAAEDLEVFAKFRSYKDMYLALDHVSFKHGLQYIREVCATGDWKKEYSEAIKFIDTLGKPKTFKFHGFGTFSPTLLRYLKVYIDLRNLFGALKDINICEVGIGFGGQMSLICLLEEPKSYTCYDITPVLNLSKRFMSELKIFKKIEYLDGRHPSVSNPDLFVSNYAFSELVPRVQQEYLENVISRASMGYITWNSLSANLYKGFSLADLIRRIPNAQILPEKPNTAPGNAIIVWGHKA